MARAFLVFLCLTFLMSHGYARSGNARIQVLSQKIIGGQDTIMLKDIVQTEGLAPSVKRQLASVVLGNAPKKGESRVFTAKAVSEIIRRAISTKGIKITIPAKVVIKNPSIAITQNNLKSLIERDWKKLCDNCRFATEVIQLPRADFSKVSQWTLGSISDLPRGSFSYPLYVNYDDGSQRTFWIQGRTKILKRVPVLKKIVHLGERVREQDIDFEYRDTTFVQKGIPDINEIVGRKLRRAMRAKEVVWREAISRERALVRGQAVKVISKSSEFEISISAIAEQDAFMGDTVKLKNTTTNHSIMGRVVGPSEVEML